VLVTADPGRRAERVLTAAQASMQAGAFGKALELLATADSGPLDEFQHAQVDLLRGQIAFASRRGSDAPPLLLKAAQSLEPLDARLSRETYLEALIAALFAGRLALGGGAREVAEAARAAPLPRQPARGPDLLLDGLALVVTQGYPAGAPMLKRAVSAFLGADVATGAGLHWLSLLQADLSAGLLWDHESWDLLSAGRVELARDVGALTALPFAATIRAGVAHVGCGVRRGRHASGGGGVGDRGHGQQQRAHCGRGVVHRFLASTQGAGIPAIRWSSRATTLRPACRTPHP
jgi:hypothetical protein